MADVKIGYAAALEQFAPTEIIDLSVAAEQHGFSGVMAADHFQPWVPAAGPGVVRLERADARSASAPRATSGPASPARRSAHHPAIVAQAAATLEAMYPGRHWLGSGLRRGAQRARRSAATGRRPPSGSA